MRSFLSLFFSAVLCIGQSFAQPVPPRTPDGNPQPEHPTERLLNAPGSIFRRDFTDVAEIGKMKIRMIKVTSLKDDKLEFTKACISYDPAGLNLPGTKSTNLDIATAEELRQNFIDIQSKVMSKNAGGYSEVLFKTRTNIMGGCYWTSNGWAIFMKPISNDNDLYVYFEKEELGKLIAAFDQVKTKLAAAKNDLSK